MICPTQCIQPTSRQTDFLKRVLNSWTWWSLFSEGDTALVAYAGDAFTVSPLTSDAATLKNLIPSLSPQIMPSKGANLLAGIEQAKMLLEQGHYADGDIILVTDDVEQEEIGEVKSMLASTKFRLSVYAIGTREGTQFHSLRVDFLKTVLAKLWFQNSMSPY
ncbi:vWA domain-containing protein [Pseudoalteromonas xiamenensis]|uniref:vWA domain-containing protein n=1 Tax=Pseudoalteromonas xiamenensis TaxID=882626 RepID=UPI0031381AE4